MTALATGDLSSCAVKADQTLTCWGGLTNSTVPKAVTGLSGVTGVAFRAAGPCVTLAGGVATCWGSAYEGQIGNGPPASPPVTSYSSAVQVTGLTGLPSVAGTAVSASYFDSCTLLTDGTVKCWGDNSAGALGNGTTATPEATPGLVHGLGNVTSLSVNGGTACAVVVIGSVRCWGYGADGELGNGSSKSSTISVAVSGITTATSVAVGGNFACALLVDSSVRCWGANDQGQLGTGTTTARLTPVAVPKVGAIVSLSAGAEHACGLRVDGLVVCWGANLSGEQGPGITAPMVTVPHGVDGVSAVTALAAGGSDTCAVLVGGTAECWGADDLGQIGNGTTVTTGCKCISTPTTVSGVGTVTRVATSIAHGCELSVDNTEKCWGQNAAGELGNGSTTDSPTPVSVNGIVSGIGLAVGGYHSCALINGGNVRCWGSGMYGELGNGGYVGSKVPVDAIAPAA